MFIGRQAELQVLERAYRSRRTEFIPVYGRRRVGKSELILHFIRHKPALYFLGKKAPPQFQIRAFMETAARALGQPLLASVSAADWGTALGTVLSQKSGTAKLVLAFDEFQWTAEASPELPSILQEQLDRSWKKRSDVLLILCGSYIGFMERDVLGEGSPLFGRRTAQILLKPFPFREAALFHPGWSAADRAQAYFVCGGVPLYLRFFSPADSIRANIENNLLGEFAPLYREPDFLLREELREVANYHAILVALSSGSRASAAIARQTGLPERNLHYYLQQLTELGYVSRRYPVTGRRPVARNVRFALDDPLLRFWFRFVYPHLGFIAQMGPRRSFQELIKPDLESYFGACFERLCREALPLLYEREGVGAAYEIGEYWDKQTQIDIVGLRQDNRTDIGECKWGAVRSPRALADELQKKIDSYPNQRGATIQGRLFTRRKLKRRTAPAPVSFHALEELYA